MMQNAYRYHFSKIEIFKNLSHFSSFFAEIGARFHHLQASLDKADWNLYKYIKNDWTRASGILLYLKIWYQISKNRVILYLNASGPPKHQIWPLPQIFKIQKGSVELVMELREYWWKFVTSGRRGRNVSIDFTATPIGVPLSKIERLQRIQRLDGEPSIEILTG